MLVLMASTCRSPASSWPTVGWVFGCKSLLSLPHCVTLSSHAPRPSSTACGCGQRSLPGAVLGHPCALGCPLCSFNRIWHHACHHGPSMGNSHIRLEKLQTRAIKKQADLHIRESSQLIFHGERINKTLRN